MCVIKALDPILPRAPIPRADSISALPAAKDVTLKRRTVQFAMQRLMVRGHDRNFCRPEYCCRELPP